MAALPFDSRGLETRFSGLASDVGALRTSPFTLMDPTFRLFGMESYPSRSALLNGLDRFFSGLRGDLCSRLRGR